MTKEQAKQRIAKLKKLINRHRYLYHVLDRQEISDSALDSLKKELFDLEERFPDLITPDSPSQRVSGRALDKFVKVGHRRPMLSLNDAFNREDMLNWQSRIKKLLTKEEEQSLTYFVEPKIDGLAVSLIYQNGVFQRGATRGDGRTGEDVTHNLKTIEDIPLRLEKEISCEVRGEVFITKKDFIKLNKERQKKGENVYANPRNTAAGSVRQLDPKAAGERCLSFLAWQLLGRVSQVQEQAALKELGLRPVQGRHCRNLTEVFALHALWQKQRDKFSFQLDGVVVSVNNNQLFEKLGTAGKAPRGAIAFKFPLKEAASRVLEIKLQVGRTGAITPVAILEPVNISGALITRATLHNQEEIERLDLKIGDTVIVGRAGDVIPKVVKVLKDLRGGREKPFKMPEVCPICQSKLVKKPEEAVWRCLNPACWVRQKRQLYHFVSKKAFDIEGLGPKIIDQLLEEGLIADAADLFALKKGDLLPLARFAQKSADNLIEAVEEAKNISLSRFIFALGIRGVGEETAVLLSHELFRKELNSFQKGRSLTPSFILKTIERQSLDALQQIKDIGPVAAQSIYDWFHNKNNIRFLERLDKAGIRIAAAQGKEGVKLFPERKELNSFHDKIFVLTGALETMTRDQAKEKIRQRGGDVSSSVSKKTDFVVIGKEPGSKLARAKKLQLKVMSEREFIQLLKND